jgi:hypothetical protein
MLAQLDFARGLTDRMNVAGVDVMVNSVCPPIVVTLGCEEFLELRDEFLQILGSSGAQVQFCTGYHLLQVLTEPASPLRLGFQIVFQHRLQDWFTAA